MIAFIRGTVTLLVIFGLFLLGPPFIYLKVTGEPVNGMLILLHLIAVFFFGSHVMVWICRIPKIGPFIREGVFYLNGKER